MRIQVQKDGWAAIRWPDGTIDARIAELPSGRLGIVELKVAEEDGITADILRSIPLGKFEAWLNEPGFAEQIRDLIAGKRRSITSADRRRNLKIRKPSQRTKPDSFYRRVAEVFSYAATQSASPAKDIATASDVPVTTVHRWVRESRRRGLLAPGERGKGGR